MNSESLDAKGVAPTARATPARGLTDATGSVLHMAHGVEYLHLSSRLGAHLLLLLRMSHAADGLGETLV